MSPIGIIAKSGVVHLRAVQVVRELGIELIWPVGRDRTVRTAPGNPVLPGAGTTWKSRVQGAGG